MLLGVATGHSRCPSHQVDTGVGAALLLPAYIHAHALLCGEYIYSPSFLFLCCVLPSLDCLISLREFTLVDVALSLSFS